MNRNFNSGELGLKSGQISSNNRGINQGEQYLMRPQTVGEKSEAWLRPGGKLPIGALMSDRLKHHSFCRANNQRLTINDLNI